MSTLWRQSQRGEDSWQATTLDDPCQLPFEIRSVGQASEAAVALLLLPGKTGLVNGEPVLGGLRILSHRDEIVSASQRFYYSAQSKPVVSIHSYAPGARRLKCPVCRMAIEEGQSVVVCPQRECSRVYHQMDAEGDRPPKHCWTYRPECLCKHPTPLAEENIWRPEREETPYA